VTRCDGETGQAGNRDNPPNVGGVTAWYAEWDPVRGPHQGQQSKVDCINRPNRRLLPTNANTSNFACNAGAIHRRRSLNCGGGCSDEFVQQRSRRAKVRRIDVIAEPLDYWGKCVPSITDTALTLPVARQTSRGSQIPEPRALGPGKLDTMEQHPRLLLHIIDP
jgi:hypothetical protein